MQMSCSPRLSSSCCTRAANPRGTSDEAVGAFLVEIVSASVGVFKQLVELPIGDGGLHINTTNVGQAHLHTTSTKPPSTLQVNHLSRNWYQMILHATKQNCEIRLHRATFLAQRTESLALDTSAPRKVSKTSKTGISRQSLFEYLIQRPKYKVEYFIAVLI